MLQTKSMIFDGPGKPWRIWRGETPRLNHGRTLVRVLACTICGSDIHSIRGRRLVPTPSILGHEIVGEIEAFGCDQPRLTIDGLALQVGDRVCWSIVTNCDACYYCEHGLPQKCVAGMKYGHQAWSTCRDLTGGFSEHCILQPGTKIMRLPRALPLEIACPIGCATSTIAAAIEAAGIRNGDSILVVGAGTLGLTATAMAKQAGAKHVFCLETNEYRRILSAKFGVDHALDQATLKDECLQNTSGRGVDCVIECSGSQQALSQALPSVRLGGKIVLVGSVFPGCNVDIDLEQIVRRNLSIFGIHNYAPRHLQQAVVFATNNACVNPFQELVTDWFALDDIEAAIEKAGHGKSLRVGLKM